jgi:hypothetical protein
MALLPLDIRNRTSEVRRAVRDARRVTNMLQGTMSLEGQGLDGKTLRELKRTTILELLGRS